MLRIAICDDDSALEIQKGIGGLWVSGGENLYEGTDSCFSKNCLEAELAL